MGDAAKDYLSRYVSPTLLTGLTELCKKKPMDPYVSVSFHIKVFFKKKFWYSVKRFGNFNFNLQFYFDTVKWCYWCF